jgi:alpha-L-fucosidase
MEGTGNIQTFEVTVSNVGDRGWVLADDTVKVTIESESVTTVKPGIIKRLRPGDQVVVQVGVRNKIGVASGTTGIATARLKSNAVDVAHEFEATFGSGPYEPTYESIYSHESPDWYNGAKFGIFIHWGLYSIPAWVRSRKPSHTHFKRNCMITLMDYTCRATQDPTKHMQNGKTRIS